LKKILIFKEKKGTIAICYRKQDYTTQPVLTFNVE